MHLHQCHRRPCSLYWQTLLWRCAIILDVLRPKCVELVARPICAFGMWQHTIRRQIVPRHFMACAPLRNLRVAGALGRHSHDEIRPKGHRHGCHPPPKRLEHAAQVSGADEESGASRGEIVLELCEAVVDK
eukprot:1328-Prymnesium_polylepis.2